MMSSVFCFLVGSDFEQLPFDHLSLLLVDVVPPFREITDFCPDHLPPEEHRARGRQLHTHACWETPTGELQLSAG